MWRYIGNITIVAVLAIMLAVNGASLEMSILAGFTAGCFYTLCDISRALHKS
jgi:hypothetical protein